MQQRFLVLSALMSALWLGSSGVSLAEPATKAQPAQPAQPKLGQAATPATPAIPATPASPEAPAFGWQMMTEQEREAYRERMRATTTREEREQIRLEHHQQMLERARERGITLPEEPLNGSGQGMGQGMGKGGGRGGR